MIVIDRERLIAMREMMKRHFSDFLVVFNWWWQFMHTCQCSIYSVSVNFNRQWLWYLLIKRKIFNFVQLNGLWLVMEHDNYMVSNQRLMLRTWFAAINMLDSYHEMYTMSVLSSEFNKENHTHARHYVHSLSLHTHTHTYTHTHTFKWNAVSLGGRIK